MTAVQDVSRTSRYWGDSTPGEAEKVEFGKDCDRVLYSSAFRRLNGVTQVVSADETVLFHNRLTHSLKVAQIGVLLTNHLRKQIAADGLDDVVAQHGGLDSRVVRAACMAHDLGHPPFGHVAEEALQQLPDGTLPDSFEGNAQSFRIATKLAFREPHVDLDNASPALNLCAGTLMALSKYPWGYTEQKNYMDPQRGNKKKWGFYESERHIFEWAKKSVPAAYEPDTAEHRTIEAQIMDWADDISYAIHDVEDFFRTRLVPLDVLQNSEEEFNAFFDYAWDGVSKATSGQVQESEVRQWITKLRTDLLPRHRYTGSRQDREWLHTFASTLIMDAVEHTRLNERGVVEPAVKLRAIIEFFKQMTHYYVINRPALGSIQHGQMRLIENLFRDLTQWAGDQWKGQSAGTNGSRERHSLPVQLVDYLHVSFSSNEVTGSNYDRRDQKIARAVVDYIASLTERQAIALGARLSGYTTTSVLERWF